MAFSTALYYPWIDIRDEAWLKSALLYWDAVRTIVPMSISKPYTTDTGCQLHDAGFLIPLRVSSNMREIEQLADDVVSYMRTNEGTEFLVTGLEQHRADIHDKFCGLATIHPDKLPWVIRHQLASAMHSRDRGEWLKVDSRFADFYLTLLATHLSERVGAGLLTRFTNAVRLALSVRMDSQVPAVFPIVLSMEDRLREEYKAMRPRRNAPRTLASGLLAHLTLERISIDPDTPVDKILEFREQHKDELALFRLNIEKLTSTINSDLPIEALRQRLQDIYAHEVDPALANLKKSLQGRRIHWLGEGLLKIAFISAGSSSVLLALGLSTPMALLAGTGLSLVVYGALYNVDREEALRNNPYSYLLAVDKKLG